MKAKDVEPGIEVRTVGNIWEEVRAVALTQQYEKTYRVWIFFQGNNIPMAFRLDDEVETRLKDEK